MRKYTLKDTPPRPQGAWHPSGRGEGHTFGAFDFSGGAKFNFKDVPKNFKLLARANELRKAKYLHEAKLWKKLNRAQMCGLDFHRQQVIGNYIVDFVCYKIGLIIEADGASHKNKKEYDENRDNYLKSLGFTILHIPVKEILKNINSVSEKIKHHIEALPLYKRGGEPLAGETGCPNHEV